MFGLNQAPPECHVYFESAQSRGPFRCEQSGTRPRRVSLSGIPGSGRGPRVFGQKKREDGKAHVMAEPLRYVSVD